MKLFTWRHLTGAALLAVLAACGGNMTPDLTTRVEVLANSERGMQSVAFDASYAYVALANARDGASGVMRSAAAITGDAHWSALSMGACALPAYASGDFARAPQLRRVGGKTYLFQQTMEQPAAKPLEHSLCELDTAGTAFTPRDQALQRCAFGYCGALWMDDLQQIGTRMFSNAGAGENVLVSDDQGASWRALIGSLDAHVCTHQSFRVVGTRLLTGGECPLDMAYLRAYQLSADGGHLASATPLPIQLPDLENRNVQFIDVVPGTQKVFAGVEGGLLRSDDGGLTYKFAFREPLSGGKSYPYITRFLSPAKQPNVVVVAGFDKASGKPYLAWSADGGDKWTELSALLPGYQRAADSAATTQVTSLVEDPKGRILLTVNQDLDKGGKLLLLKLGAH